MNEFKKIEEYISLLKEDRQKHLNLNDKCIEIGGDSRTCRAMLAHYLKTTIPTGMKIQMCHACNNACCSNVNHLYWGTPSENIQDAFKSGARKSIKNILIKKYSSKEAYKKQMGVCGKKGWQNGSHDKYFLSKKEIERRIDLINEIGLKKYGAISKIATILNISHTQVRRFIQKYYITL
jgi:hypothetical protein